MLMGEFQHNIDEKGRFFIPAKFREEMGDQIVVAKSLDKTPCLFVYSAAEWQKLVDKISEKPFSSSRKLQRYLFSVAIDAEYDAQGRILIPLQLREFAALTEPQKAMVIGVNNRLEIWNQENWANEEDDISQDEILKALEECEL